MKPFALKQEDATVSCLYDLSHTVASSILSKVTYPWEVLPNLKEEIVKLGETLPKDEYDRLDGNIWIAKSARVAPTASLTGPLILSENCEIRHGAYLRGSAIVGKNAVVGNSVELKNCILFDNVQVPHFNYVGDSVIGYKSHLGAGAVTSNVKSDKSLVVLHFADGDCATGYRKFGACLGDCVEVGCNSVLNPGTVIGKGTNVYPLSSVRGTVAGGMIFKKEGAVVKKI